MPTALHSRLCYHCCEIKRPVIVLFGEANQARVGLFELDHGSQTVLVSSASGASVASTRGKCTIVTSGISGGLPRMMSSACTWGHGTQLRQPVSCFCRSHTTPRSPRIATLLFNSAETFWLMVGLSRFQLTVLKMIATTINNKKATEIAAVILPALLIVRFLIFFLCQS